MTDTTTMPALFLAHGTPMNALGDNLWADDWRRLNSDTPRPEAIICISAHWQTAGSRITSSLRPKTIHDFGGFPEQLFSMQYPCPGAPKLAAELATEFGLQQDHDWGLDHGCWSLLSQLYPTADIPVLQLSLDCNKSLDEHYRLGQQLAALRARGILIIGSGNIVHNIGKWMANPTGPFDWARDFNDAVLAAIARGDHQQLIDYQHLPCARDAVPTDEHYLPLLYILACQQASDNISHSQLAATSLENCSMVSLRIGP